jgi:hypothetical protein
MPPIDLTADYFRYVNEIANECLKRAVPAVEFLETPPSGWGEIVRQLVDIRSRLVTSDDAANAAGMLSTGYFVTYIGADRIAAFAAQADISARCQQLFLQRRCSPYSRGDALFHAYPHLFDTLLNDELIPLSEVPRRRGAGHVAVGSHFAAIDGAVTPELLDWVTDTFPTLPKWIRLDAHSLWDKCPMRTVREAIIVPTRPEWWRDLSVINRTNFHARHDLFPVTPSPQTVLEFWDYEVRHIRRLEVNVARDGRGTLSLLIEELSHIDPATQQLLGYCLHLDTVDPVGTSFAASTLLHLDLAINLYECQRAAEREAATLRDGVNVEATSRTHIFRINNVPFTSLPGFCRRFFRAASLADEYLHAQFGAEA